VKQRQILQFSSAQTRLCNVQTFQNFIQIHILNLQLTGDFINFDDFARKIRNLSKCRPPFNHGYWMLFLKKPNQVVMQSGSAAGKSCSRYQLALPWGGVSRIFWVGFENIVGQLNHYNREETYRQTSCIKC